MDALILLCNDDGVHAAGNIALRDALAPLGRVVTVVPEHNQSAGSHSITLHRPLRHREVEPDVHAVDGTPADCIYIALFHGDILPRMPNVVVSGINHGPNLGSDVFYSGTVAAAREGALRGIPALAVSQCSGLDYTPAATLTRQMVASLLTQLPLDAPTPLLNVNLPGPSWSSVRATCLGQRHYEDEVTIRHDPRGRPYVWIGGPGARHGAVTGSDTEAIDAGIVSVTPLRLDTTCMVHQRLAQQLVASSATVQTSHTGAEA
ncbi:MAG: 5'/3'-nucleotidase SurE [Polyangiales bacterium]